MYFGIVNDAMATTRHNAVYELSTFEWLIRHTQFMQIVSDDLCALEILPLNQQS